MSPLLQAFVGATVALSIVLLATGLVHVAWTAPIVVLIYAFSIAPGIAGVLFARRSLNPLVILWQVVLAHGYAFYSWIIFPVVYRALWRQLIGVRTWAKTRREPIT